MESVWLPTQLLLSFNCVHQPDGADVVDLLVAVEWEHSDPLVELPQFLILLLAHLLAVEAMRYLFILQQ